MQKLTTDLKHTKEFNSFRKIMNNNGPYHYRVSIITASVISLSLCLLVLTSFYYGQIMATRYTPMIDAVMEIMLDATTAHLWSEEILSGDNNESIDNIWSNLSEAEWYARAMLEGGKNHKVDLNPVDDAVMRQEINHVLEHLTTFKKTTEERLAAQAKPGSDIDQRYDAAFAEILSHANQLENRLKAVIDNKLEQFKLAQQGLILLIIIATIIGINMIARNQRWWRSHTAALDHAQKIARESERMLSTLIDNLQGIVYRCRKDECWTMVFISEGCLDVTGYSSKDLLDNQSISYADLIVDEDREMVTEIIDKATSEGNPFELTYRIQCKDGEIRWVWEKGRQVPGDSNGFDTLEGVINDITQIKQAEAQLARADAEWTQAMDQFDGIVYLVDMERNLLRANDAFYRLLDATPKECLGRHITELIHPNGKSDNCVICQIQESHIETVVTVEADDINNPTNKPLEVTLKLVKENNDTPIGMIISMHDLGHARDIEERLRLSASAFANSVEGIIITDAEGFIIEVNQAFTDILGFERKEVIGRNPRIFKSGRHDQDFYRNMRKSLDTTGQWRGEIWNRRKDGSIFPEWLTISSVHDTNNRVTHYMGIFSDLTQIKRSQDQLDHLSRHDPLTDLPNRLLLHERIDQAIKRANRQNSRLAVVFVDIDRFKQINDSFGHPVGDHLLQSISTRLLAHTRESDTIARIGGDVFVLLLEDIKTVEKAGVAAYHAMSAFNDPYKLNGREIRITASMGIAIFPGDAADATTLMRNADTALTRAKEAGRNQYQFYTEELTQNALKRISLENSLRQAVLSKEFFLVYQPQVELDSGKIIGAETLIRWNHPELGMVSPAQFIPLAEDTGLIHDIGSQVLDMACRQGESWLKKGLEFGRLAINIAGPQIQRGDLTSEVADTLARTGFPPSYLELEVTEGFIMQEAETAIDQLNTLRDLDITLSIDDFGTGYSSLSYLKRLPIHTLKIDQSFMRDIPNNSEDIAITQAIIALGNSLGMSIIAEGVESAEQSQFLREHGCKLGQGYFYSKPLSAEEFEDLLHRHKP